MTLTEEQIAEIRARAEAATPGNLDTVNDPPDEYGGRFEGVYDCPMCNGDGSVDGVTYCNFDDVAMGVQFFGIGEEHGKYEQFFRAANPAAVLALLSALEAAQSANRPRDDYPVFCSDCGRAHVLDTVLPSEIWNKIASPDDLLCVVCIDTRLKKAGLTAEAEFYYSGDALRSRLYGDADALEAANKRADEAEHTVSLLRDAARGATVITNTAADEIRALRARVAELEGQYADKVDGLESDLSSAVDVLFRRGDDEAREWIRLNYPTQYERLVARATLRGAGHERG